MLGPSYTLPRNFSCSHGVENSCTCGYIPKRIDCFQLIALRNFRKAWVLLTQADIHVGGRMMIRTMRAMRALLSAAASC